MADPISAEPKNWEEDILLKLTMPGKSLREVTKIKMKQAEIRMEERLNRNESAPKKEVPILGLRQNNIQPVQNTQPIQPQVQQSSTSNFQNSSEQEIENPSEVYHQKVQSAPQESELSQEQVQPEILSQETEEFKEVVQETLFDIQEPEVQQEVEETQEPVLNEPSNIEPEIEPESAIQNYNEPAEEIAEEIQDEPQLTESEPINNLTDFTIKEPEKIKIMTIEPQKEETVKNVPPHLSTSIDLRKIENFANKIIGSDLLYRKKN